MRTIANEVPFNRLTKWMGRAWRHEPDANCAMLATIAGPDHAQATVRPVLVKYWSPEGGLVFFTNRRSEKGESLRIYETPAGRTRYWRAELCWHWKSLRRVVRARGLLATLSPAASDRYWRQRPFLSRLASACSAQSQPMPSALSLPRAMALRFLRDRVVARPECWVGVALMPYQWEFWQERSYRMHHRLQLLPDHDSGGWQPRLLYP